MPKADRVHSIHSGGEASWRPTLMRLILMMVVSLTIPSCTMDHISGEFFIVWPGGLDDTADSAPDSNHQATPASIVVEEPSTEKRPKSRAAK